MEKRVSAAEKDTEKLILHIQKETDLLKGENKSTSKRLKESNERIKDLEMENAVLRQGLGNSTFGKEETKEKVKALIDEYAREVERNLRSIEGLQPAEVNDLMKHEMKDLLDYIPKSILGKK